MVFIYLFFYLFSVPLLIIKVILFTATHAEFGLDESVMLLTLVWRPLMKEEIVEVMQEFALWYVSQ